VTAKRGGLIDLFINHRVAANLLMAFMLLAGLWSLTRLNTQFLPTFSVHVISVGIKWPGASADDVEKSVTIPIEKELRDIDELKEMKSVSRDGFGQISLEFRQGADMAHALNQVKERVDLVRDLPMAAEEPEVQRIMNYEPIAKVLVSGSQHLGEMRPLVRNMERQLLDSGIAKVNVTGLPEQEIAIQIPISKLVDLNMSLSQIAALIAKRSIDLPAGTIGRHEAGRQLRSLSQQRDIKGFDHLPLISDESGRLLRLGDIATITLRPLDKEITIEYQGKPAVELALLRSETANALKSAAILHAWLASVKKTLPPGISVHIYDQRWQYIKQRINLLIKNGAIGFLLIIGMLFFLLNRQVALWVAMGIPVTLCAALAALHFLGGSINMVSLFAFIMTLGIIVDDTIVVGEETLSQLQQGQSIVPAVRIGARRMLWPILASSFTTIAAFLPLMLIGGIIGTILRAIPLVVICVILASLLECFLVLPGHLRHSFQRRAFAAKQHRLRNLIDTRFEYFKQHFFRRLVTAATKNYGLTLAIAAVIFLLSMALVVGGWINFTFFPAPDGSIMRANIEFNAGTPPAKVQRFLNHIEQALWATEKQFNQQKMILTAIKINNIATTDRFEQGVNQGDEYAHLFVELTQPDDRTVTNQRFISAWRKRITVPPSVEDFTIITPRPGPPGKDIDIKIVGDQPEKLKAAADMLRNKLASYRGVSAIQDNLPFGQEQFIYTLKPAGRALGLTLEDVGRQLRAAFNGEIAQIFHIPNEEIEVRVMLPDKQRYHLAALEHLPIVTAKNEVVPLSNVVRLTVQRGLNVLRHTNTELTANVTAEVDAKVTNANKIINALSKKVIPDINERYGVKTDFVGRATEQADTLADMQYGIVLALGLIYIILAWVFASYSLPLIIMLAIPLGLTGAIFGHLFLGYDITILSLFGLFGLSGIVINDSIILVNRYLLLRKGKMTPGEAIVEAACQRLRPVILTSATTIAGLLPLLSERSLQAQFLIPMAISIAFGLLFSTALVLVVVPAMLAVYSRVRA